MSLLKSKKAIDNELFLLKKPREYTKEELCMLSDGLEEELNACDDKIEKLEIESTLIKLLRADLGNYSDKLREIKNDVDSELWKSEKIDVSDAEPASDEPGCSDETKTEPEVEDIVDESKTMRLIDEKAGPVADVKEDNDRPGGSATIPTVQLAMVDGRSDNDALSEQVEDRLMNIRMSQPIRTQPGNDGAFRILQLINRAIIVDGKLDPDINNIAMTHVNYRFPVNLIGKRASDWVPKELKRTMTRKNPLRNIHGRLDGEFFKVINAVTTHEFDWYPGRWREGSIKIQAVEVPGGRHTPDYPLERIEMGRIFCMKHVVAVNLTPPTIILRCTNGEDVELRYRVRNKLRSREDGERFRQL